MYQLIVNKVWKTFPRSGIGLLHRSVLYFHCCRVECKYGQLVAVSSCNFILTTVTGEFDLDAVPVYNMVNVGRFIINSFENAFNFCVTVGLLNK